MMKYDLFKTVVLERIHDFLPEAFQDYVPEVREVRKVNIVKDGFCMVPPMPRTNLALPTLYMDDIYEDFCQDQDLNRVMTEIACVFTTYSGRYVPDDMVPDIKELKDSIVMNLINTELNKRLLEDLPHRNVMDLSVIYRVIVDKTEEGMNSFLLSYEMLKELDIDEEELYDLALENSRRIFPARMLPGHDDIYIMTNEAGINGATTMLYEKEMKDLSEIIGGDFFILPSSIHEFFAIPVEIGELEDLARMLVGGNYTVTRAADVLSRSIYMYSGETGSLIKCATCVQMRERCS